ncbi:glycosyltransferase family 2 protein [Irpex lacteus]|nr:glycosyltransferase family 2 protein [Irpex lacteus]
MSRHRHDLATLPSVSDDIIVSCLRERFMADTIYTNMDPLLSNSDAVLHKYAAEYRDTTPGKVLLPPHIFQLANNAYYHMRRTSQDQCILLSGETGSGKSESRRLAIKTILDLSVSNPGKKGAKLGQQLPAAEFVLESFGNARTLFNSNASRFGKYTELQFTERGRLCGAKTIDYYLERNRVASVPSGERNFHIFYYLMAGASQEERDISIPAQRAPPSRPGQGREEDAVRFDQLKNALKNVGFSKRHVAQTCQLIAAILHLGNLEFTIDRSRNEDAAVVRNLDVLDIPAALEVALTYRTRLVKKELCTVFLDPDGAADNRDELAITLYSLLFTWLNEHINQLLCQLRQRNPPHFIQKRLFESHVPYFDNAECIRLLTHKPGGLIHIMDDQARRQPRKTNQTMVEAFNKRWGNHSSFKVGAADRSGFPTFTVNHFTGPVTYSSEGFLERNQDLMSPDFVSLLRGTSTSDAPAADGTGSINPFVRGLFTSKAVATQVHPRNEETIISAQQPVKPMRAPSTRRKGTIKRMPTLRETGDDEKEEEEPATDGTPCIAGQFRAALATLFETLEEAQAWYVFCITPNDSQLPNQLEGRSVKGQVSRRCVNVFEAAMTPKEFVDRYRETLDTVNVHEGEEREQVDQARTALGLEERDLVLGSTMVFLSHAAFHRLEDDLRSRDTEELKRNRMRDAEAEAGLDPRGLNDYAPYSTPDAEGPYEGGYNDPFGQSNQALPLVAHASPFNDEYDEAKSLRSEDYDVRSALTSARDNESVSQFGTESYAPSRNMFQNADKGLSDKEPLAGEIQEGETVEVIKETSARRRWVAFVWLLTWWCPTIFLKWFGRMKRPDIQQAWREKLALNIIIWFMCGCAIFVIAVIGPLICPTQHVFSTSELQSHSFQNKPNNVYTAIRGERVIPVVPEKSILKYGGVAADNIFPVQVSALCNGVTGSVSPYVALDSSNNTDPNSQYHDFRVVTGDSRPDWYFESMTLMRWNNRVGFMGYTSKELKNMANSKKTVGVYRSMVYDLTNYVTNGPAVQSPKGEQAPGGIDTHFMHQDIVNIFQFNSGQDVTKKLDALKIDPEVMGWQRTCLRNLFLIGRVDNRNSPQCQFSQYILLALSIMMVAVIGFKFIASINFGSARAPEDHDKFVICQVPCYTEASVHICDGMVVGAGNDQPTPRIVLDVLGASPNVDAEPLSFLSLGEGAKQHNMGKVFSGLYETSGHVVPYIVVVKCGRPAEKQRPGNRGKRDSQMILMHFLNKVHFNSPMNPLELEIYHQIKNVIGVNPTFYEYVFMVDADTTVAPLSLNRLVSAMIHDKKLLGVCGETELANAKQSLITMMQVYEYFISHHMAKAFESLFGSVTCLPGCFTLYRLRTPDTHKPLLISNQLIQDYSENRVDTLHMKNLLHLGEDRYLTTLLLKHFSNFKTQFVRDAHAYTVAPDDWKVLLSQRRRWINSTVHNLGELVFLDQLCGFCCFSMRFVVMVDLLSTIIQPVTVAYIIYLIYLTAGEGKAIPTLSIIMIAAVYGVQALVFVLRRKWDMIGWMVFYILAIPVFSFFLPLYSFWRMDDFSWGQTRIVMGESGKKLVVHDEGKFDPRTIPLKSWNDYENELWDKESNHSIGLSRVSHCLRLRSETYYEPAMSRAYSPSPSQAGMMYPPPGYQSGRNTPMSTGYGGGVVHAPCPRVLRPTTWIPEDVDLMGGPSDMELDQAVVRLLQDADLTMVTKREVRRQLEGQFGMDLSNRKAAINAAIDRVLLSRAAT